MKILLTGATGFIGSAFLRLALQGEHIIGALVRARKLAPAPRQDGRLELFEGTLLDAPWEEMKSFQPDACVHCAWTTAPKVPYDSPEHLRFFEESRNFLDRLIGLGVRQVLGLGTCIEYQIGNEPLREDSTPIGPVGPYAESKNLMREWLEEASLRQGFQLCWGRVFYVYGVGEDPTRLCTSLIRRFQRNESLILKTPHSTKDYIYIEDVARALLMLLEKNFSGSVNIGTGLGISIHDLAQTVASLLGKTGLVEIAAKESRDPLGYVVAESTRLRNIGWKPNFELDRGLLEMIAALY